MNKAKPLKFKTPESKVFYTTGLQNMFNLLIIIPYYKVVSGHLCSNLVD